MKHIDLFNIKLNHIRIFLTAVEYGGFTAAAEKLHLTQPFVSKSIQHLEDELGLYLIIRGSRKFQVTPAGWRLYEEWSDLMQGFENALTSAHSVQSGLTDKLTIGVGELEPKDSVIMAGIRQTNDLLPGLDIFIQNNDMASLLHLVLKGDLDMAAISKHMLPMIKDTDLEWKTVVKSNLAVYVHKSNPLYERDKVAFADLKQERFVVFSAENDDSYLNLLKALGQEAGFVPQIACYVPNELSFKVNLAMGNGVVLADSFVDLADEDVKRFELEQRCDIIMIWKPDNYRECMRVLLSQFDDLDNE